ncbi:uncharacterized protein WM277_025900 [Molossus nigricans]
MGGSRSLKEQTGPCFRPRRQRNLQETVSLRLSLNYEQEVPGSKRQIMNWEPCGKTSLELSQDSVLGFFQMTPHSSIWSQVLWMGFGNTHFTRASLLISQGIHATWYQKMIPKERQMNVSHPPSMSKPRG